MATEKATGLVLRTTDWSETSRIATVWTRELGKVRALAKGGRRLKSNFDTALDLLTLCSIVLLRKTSGSLDLLTEARVERRFPRLQQDLSALYAAYYVAELLSDLTEDYDPHPALYDEALTTLDFLGGGADPVAGEVAARLLRFEVVLLRELGYVPALESCVACGGEMRAPLAFSCAAGGVVCRACQPRHPDRRPLSTGAFGALGLLAANGDEWRGVRHPAARAEVRQVLGQYVTYLLGRRPRMLAYLGG